MDEQTGDLQSRDTPDTESADSEMLAGIEALLSGDGDNPFPQGAVPEGAEEGDTASFYSFCAQLAAAVPVADDRFRARLLAELMGNTTIEAATEEQGAPTSISAPKPSTQPAVHAEAAKPPRPRLWDRLSGGSKQEIRNRNGAGNLVAARQQSRGRIARLAMGGVGIAVLLALFAGMTVMLRLRQEATGAGPTPTSQGAAPSDSSRVLPGVAPVQTLDTTGVQYMAWSFDGSMLATGYGSNVELWDGMSGQPLHTIAVSSVSGLDWSPNSHLLAVESPGSVRIFDAATGQEMHPAPPNGAAEPNDRAAWSPDGKTVASSFSPVVASTPGTGVPVGGNGNFSPDGPVAPLPVVPPSTPAPGENDVLLKLWDATTGDTRRILRMPADPQELGPRTMDKVSWAHDGRYLAALFSDGTIGVWDSANAGRQDPKFDISTVRTVTVYGDAVHGFDWSPDGHTLAALDGTVVKLWDADTGKQVGMVPDVVPPPVVPPTQIPTAVNPLITPPVWVPPPMPTDIHGNTITPVPTVLLSPSPTYVYRDQEYGVVGGLAWSPDGHTLATFDGSNISLWDAATGRQEHRLISNGAIRKLAWSPDGGVLFSLQGERAKSPPEQAFLMVADQYAFLDGTLKLWDAATGKELRAISQDGLSDFAISPDGKSLALRVGISATLWSAGDLPVAGTYVPPETATSEPTGMPTPAPAQAPCGSWSVAGIPSPEAEGELRAVSATSGQAADVWAVGLLGRAHDDYAPAGAPARTWTLHWDGTRWLAVSSPNQGDGDNVLNGVAAISSRDAWAVGYYSATATLRQALILHWDGSAWSNMPAPDLNNGNGNGKGSALNAVSARAADDVWAVGTLDNAFTLSLHWDGKSWTQMPSPNPGIDLNTLTTVSARSGGDVWAAGQYVQHYQPAGMAQGIPLILLWDSSRWKPAPATFNGTFIRALGTAPDGAGWVVGGYAGEGGGAAAASSWNGSGWVASGLPMVGKLDANGTLNISLNSGLDGLAVISRVSAWAVGSYSVQVLTDTTGMWYEHPLVEHWDGTAWTQMATPDIGTQGSSLSAIAVISEQELWAVGHTGQYGSQDGWHYKPLILHYSGPMCATPQPASPTPDKRMAIPAVTGLPQTSTPVPANTAVPKGMEEPPAGASPKAARP